MPGTDNLPGRIGIRDKSVTKVIADHLIVILISGWIWRQAIRVLTPQTVLVHLAGKQYDSVLHTYEA